MERGLSSGGIGAILSTMKHANDKAGLLRSAKALINMNSPGGFDCPGCAWPEPKDRARFEFCENGAKALMNATTTKVANREFFARHSIDELCAWSDYELSNCGRLVDPVIRRPGQSHFEPISYDEAYDLVAEHLKALSDKNRAVFYTSGRASNEAAFLYQLFARKLGTNNLCDCSNLCHESSGVALKRAIGIGKGTVQLEDFREAEVIFLIGHNPSTNHPRMLTTLREARAKGARIIVINPLIEPGLKKFRHPQKINDMLGTAKEIATHYYQVVVGGDHALFNAIAHVLLFNQKFGPSIRNEGFLSDHTSGFNEFAASLRELELKKLVADSGVTLQDITTIAEIVSVADRVIYAWGMGITQTTYGVNTIEAIVNLALLRGHIGKTGAGLCPVRGHSNVQGNRTVGITEKPSAQFLDRLKRVFGFMPPTQHGFDVVESIHAMKKNQVDVFMSLGGNFLSAGPDTEETAQAMHNCQLAVNISTSLNRTHLLAGKSALIIPTLTRVEKDVQHGKEQIQSVENSMSIVHSSKGNFAPIKADIPSEVTIIAQIAQRCFEHESSINWQQLNRNYGAIRDAIAECLDDFADYNERLKGKNGFLLKNPASHCQFVTSSGKAQFSRALKTEKPNKDFDVLLTSIRSHDQFNTAIYGLDDRYRGVKGERRVIFMNKADIARLKLKDGDRVDLSSRFLGKLRKALDFKVKRYDIKEGCAAVYFPEGNALVPLLSVALESNTPTSKLVPIFVRARKLAKK